MKHLSGVAREQKPLLPEAVEDYVAPQAPVRFMEAFVLTLDLRALGFDKAVAADTGPSAVSSGDLLRLYLYGYLNGVRSSRLLEKECHKNLEVIWLLRNLRPDFKTLADFRRDHQKATPVNSKDKNFNEKKLRELTAGIDAKIEKYLKELDAGDEEAGHAPTALTREELEKKIAQLQKRKDDYEELSGQLDEDDKQISTTDPKPN